MKKVIVVLSAGFEELEAVTVIDLLRRANISVEVVGLRDVQLTGSRGITMLCDEVFDYYSDLDFAAVIMVGGMDNAMNLSQDEDVLKLLKEYMAKGKLVAGICATPAIVFSQAGILQGRKVTCYPSDSLVLNIDGEYVDESCVVDGNLITSQSPDTAMEFALTIINYLEGNATEVYNELHGKN